MLSVCSMLVGSITDAHQSAEEDADGEDDADDDKVGAVCFNDFWSFD